MTKINPEFISDISSLRLYTIIRDENEGVVYLQRFKISSETTPAEIRKVVDLIEAGGLCFKHGNKRTGNIKYALKDSSLAPKIKKLVLVKIVKSELAVKDEKGNLAQKPVEDTINIDLTRDASVESKIEEMTDQEASILQSIRAKLIKFFGLDVLSKSTVGVSAPVSQRNVTAQTSSSVVPSTRKVVEVARPKGRAELSREQLKIDEQKNQAARKEKREEQKLSKELDEKSDSRRRKDIKSAEKQEEIRNEDLKKALTPRKSSKKKKTS